MNNRQSPFLTTGLIVIMLAVHWLAGDKTGLYFSVEDIINGQHWRLISGHFVHADNSHLLWNCLGLAVLGTLVEQRSRTLLWAAIGIGVISVDVLLLTPFSRLEYYCGLSGVLNTLLLLALWLEWKTSRSWLIIAIALGSVAKVLVEIMTGTSLVTQISWPPYAWSHAAGLIGGLILIFTQHVVNAQLLSDHGQPEKADLTDRVNKPVLTD